MPIIINVPPLRRYTDRGIIGSALAVDYGGNTFQVFNYGLVSSNVTRFTVLREGPLGHWEQEFELPTESGMTAPTKMDGAVSAVISGDGLLVVPQGHQPINGTRESQIWPPIFIPHIAVPFPHGFGIGEMWVGGNVVVLSLDDPPPPPPPTPGGVDLTDAAVTAVANRVMSSIKAELPAGELGTQLRSVVKNGSRDGIQAEAQTGGALAALVNSIHLALPDFLKDMQSFLTTEREGLYRWAQDRDFEGANNALAQDTRLGQILAGVQALLSR